MRIADIMKMDPDYLVAHTSSRAAARRMRDREIGFLPICDRQRRVIGAITDRDIAVRVVADALSYDLPITDVMTHEVVACRPDADLEHAGRLLLAARKSQLLVLDADDRLVGIVSLSDLTFSLHGKELAAPRGSDEPRGRGA